MQHEVNDTSVYLHIAGAFLEYPATKETHDQVMADTIKMASDTVQSYGVFIHRDPQNGVTNIIRLGPGMPVQVVPGAVVRRVINEQRQALMMQQQVPRIIRQ